MTQITDLPQLLDEKYFVQVLFDATRVIRTRFWLFDLRKITEVIGEWLDIVEGLKNAVHEACVAEVLKTDAFLLAVCFLLGVLR